MPTGVEEAIAAAAVEVEAVIAEVLSLVSELTKQPKPDYALRPSSGSGSGRPAALPPPPPPRRGGK